MRRCPKKRREGSDYLSVWLVELRRSIVRQYYGKGDRVAIGLGCLALEPVVPRPRLGSHVFDAASNWR